MCHHLEGTEFPPYYILRNIDYLIVAIFKFRPNSTHYSHTHFVLSLSCSWCHQQSGRRQRSGWRRRSAVAIHTTAIYSHVTGAVRWNSTRIRKWSPTTVGFIARAPSNANGARWCIGAAAIWSSTRRLRMVQRRRRKWQRRQSQKCRWRARSQKPRQRAQNFFFFYEHHYLTMLLLKL